MTAGKWKKFIRGLCTNALAPSISKSQLLCRLFPPDSGTACLQNPMNHPSLAASESQHFSVRTTCRNPTFYPRRWNYEFTGFIRANVVSLTCRNPALCLSGDAGTHWKHRHFCKYCRRVLDHSGNRIENTENADSHGEKSSGNPQFFYLNFLCILPGSK